MSRAIVVCAVAFAASLAACSLLVSTDDLSSDAAGVDAGGDVVVADAPASSDGGSGPDAPDGGADAAIDPSLVGWWTFDETTGSTVFDKSGRGHDMAVSGVTFAPTGGKYGGAGIFATGSFGVVEALGGAGFPLSGTISIWFSHALADSGDTFNTRGLFDTWDKTRSHVFIRRYSMDAPGMLQVAVQAQSTIGDYAWVQSFIAPRDAWTHVVLAWDSSTDRAALWVNGAPVRNGPYDKYPGTKPTMQELRIGKDFIGAIDEVRLYARVLTPAEALMVP